MQISYLILIKCQRPYHVECTASRPISEVKQRWVWLVVGWVTVWEYQILFVEIRFSEYEYVVEMSMQWRWVCNGDEYLVE